MKAAKTAKDFGRVALLYGGWAAEREVSLVSGKAVHEAMLRLGIDVTLIDATRDNVLTLKAHKFDRAFNILHGTGGEDGVVQAALELQGIPYTGSGVQASAVKMNKVTAKRLWQSENLPTPDFAMLVSVGDAQAASQRFGYPVVIKPVAEGSSVGVSIVKRADQVTKAFEQAREGGRVVMAERFIKGAEMTVAILEGKALPSIRIVPAGEFYDYHAKYIAEDTQYHCPSGVPADQEKRLAELALRAFDLVGASGWGRVDFILDAAGQPWLIEINTVPGMTSHSLVPMAAKAVGISFDQLVWKILETSLEARA